MQSQHKDKINTYREYVDKEVLKCTSEGVSNFPDMVTRLDGIYPKTIIDSINRIDISPSFRKQIIESAKIRPRHKPLPLDIFHDLSPLIYIPHPLDYEWRFEPSSAHQLTQYLLESTFPGSHIAFLGTPSLFKNCGGIRDRNFHLFDNNPIISNLSRNYPNFSITKCDLLHDEIPESISDCIIADPPWYPEFYNSFIWAASRIAKINSSFLLVIPPIGTRADEYGKRERLLQYSNELGFTIEKILSGFVRYLSPPFERNALRADDIWNVPSNWRKGDLALFTKTNKSEATRPFPVINYSCWDEIVYRSVRIRVCAQQSEPDQYCQKFDSLVSGDILNTVKRSEPIRLRANVWTSGNRIFFAHSPQFIFQTITEFNQNELCGNSIPTSIFADKLLSILQIEHKENIEYLLEMNNGL